MRQSTHRCSLFYRTASHASRSTLTAAHLPPTIPCRTCIHSARPFSTGPVFPCNLPPPPTTIWPPHSRMHAFFTCTADERYTPCVRSHSASCQRAKPPRPPSQRSLWPLLGWRSHAFVAAAIMARHAQLTVRLCYSRLPRAREGRRGHATKPGVAKGAAHFLSTAGWSDREGRHRGRRYNAAWSSQA